MKIPKGFMCMACIYVHHKCNHLPFNEYPPIGKPDKDGYVEVKCMKYIKRINSLEVATCKAE